MIPQLRETHLLTLAVGLIDIVALVALERRLPRIPAALVVLIGSIAASVLLGLEELGVAVVGELPAGLTGPSLPGVGLEALPLLLAGAIGIALVAFAEAIGPANEFARKHGGQVDPNRELVALGASNAGAGLFSGFPIGSSLSKSAANDRAGAHTPASLVVAAAATALVALFLTPLFEPLPEATLGAVVVVAVSGMMRVGKMRRLWLLRRIDFWMAMIALVGVLVVPTLEALAVAVAVSLVLVVWRASEARFTLLGRAQGQLEPVELGAETDDIIPGLLIVRPDEMLFFANAAPVRDGILGAVADREPRPAVVLVDLSLTPDIDVPAIEMLEDLRDRLAADQTALWLAYVRPRVLELLDRAGVLAALGPGTVHPQILDAIVAFLRRSPGSADRIAVLVDVIAYVRERRAQAGISPESVAMLGGLEQRLSKELDEAGADAPSPRAGEVQAPPPTAPTAG